MNSAKELTELILQKYEIFRSGQLYQNAMKLVQLVKIENHNAQTNGINPIIGEYEDFEFFVNPAKELIELILQKLEIFKSVQMYLNALKLVQ